MLNCLIFHSIKIDKIEKWSDVRFEKFKFLLDEIERLNLKTTTLDKTTSGLKICLTFDDGNISDYELVFPELIKRKMKAVFFIVPGYIGKSGYLTWDKVITMHKAGMEIGSHTLNHPVDLKKLSKKDIITELSESKKIIESKLNINIKSFSFPNGNYRINMISLAKKLGYKFICTSKPGIVKNKFHLVFRNSFYNNFKKNDIHKLLLPSSYDIMKKRTFYFFRENFKKIFGVEIYIFIKKIIFNRN